MSKHFEFEMQGAIIQVRDKQRKFDMGTIRYRPETKKWIFYPDCLTGFSNEGLAEIIKILEGQE